MIFFYLSQKSENTSTRSFFQQHATEQTIEIIRILEHNIQAPLSVASLFSVSERVTKKEFKIFTQPLLEQFPNLRALQWAPIVHHDNRDAFEESARHDFKSFKITEKDINGKMVTADARGYYVPIFYCEPMSDNEQAHGYDLTSDKDRKLMLAYSKDTANSSLSSKLHLVQDRSNKAGILIAHPVYRKNVEIDSLQQRKDFIIGYSIAALMLHDVISSTLDGHAKHEMALYITDITDKAGPQVIYGDDNKLSDKQNLQMVADKIDSAKLKITNTYQLHNRTWVIQLIPMAGQYTMTASWRSYTVMFSVILFTLTILSYIQITRNKDNQLARLITEKDQEIEQRKSFEKALQIANTKLETMSFKDSLLEIYNRRKFDQYLDEEWRRGLRSNKPLSFILIDVDNFKSYNDYYGHVDGDKALQKIAQAVLACANRSMDLVARYGGEEIAIILPETNIEGALTIAEGIRKTVRLMSIPHKGNGQENIMSISGGVGCVVPQQDMQPREFISTVDAALYLAKGKGKNIIIDISEVSIHNNDHLNKPKYA